MLPISVLSAILHLFARSAPVGCAREEAEAAEGRGARVRWAVPASILRCVPGNCQLEGQIVHYRAPSLLIAPRRTVTSQLKCSATGASTSAANGGRRARILILYIYICGRAPPTNPPALAFFRRPLSRPEFA